MHQDNLSHTYCPSVSFKKCIDLSQREQLLCLILSFNFVVVNGRTFV